MTDDYSVASPLTPVRQPTGIAYWLRTWSGRLILINGLVFLALCIQSGAVFLPEMDALIAFGAKDPVRLAQGEYWRLLTPMFIHIGVIHFAVNSYMLYVIGYQLERLLGAAWFLAVYLVAGVAGNVASSVFSVTMSAGASGALFGLLGAGLFLERTIGRRIEEFTGQKPRNRAYLVTVVINLMFGFMVSFIDNSAHIGGLVAGLVLAYAMVHIRPNALHEQRKRFGIAVILCFFAVLTGGAAVGTNRQYLVRRLVKAANQESDPEAQIALYSQAISISPENSELHISRARLLFLSGDVRFAMNDVRAVIAAGDSLPKLEKLADELNSRGLMTEAWQIRRMNEHGQP